ncbi:transcription repressor OFP8-like [Phragmites australis]|uniref:transcription repressor OFP8-like n=1 Tax=Phragmites australis TaxID=29695 RepID=UPI002D7661EA|nr:transcription repressor OFP8-like [Phragmites australis]
MSTRASRRGGGGGGRQFPMGRRRHVPVVDAGCGCRPRRPRLLSLPSFLKPCQLGGKAAPRSGSSQYSCTSTSTASFSSSSGATHSTGYSTAYSSDYYSSHVYGGGATTKQEPLPKAASPAPSAAKKELSKKKPGTKKRYEKLAAAAEEGVGVAVEKESSDPRADFRDSMVQMVVEMGLCDWDGLRCMLRRLLALNAPRHHAAILTAFAEVCTQLAAAAPAAPQPSPPPAYQYRR